MTEDDRPQSPVGRRRFLCALGASIATAGVAGCAVRTTEGGVEVEFGDDEPKSVRTTGAPMQTTTPDDGGVPTTAATATESPEATRTATPTTAPKSTATATPTATPNPTATPTATPEPRRAGGTLRLTSGTLSTLDPVAATDPASTAILENLFDGLTTFPDGETTPELQLATEITVSGDDRTYTVSLREDATFHDGASVTASDVVYSWERLAASEHSRRAYYLLELLGVEHDTTGDGYDPNSMAVEALDAHTLQFRLAEPCSAALELLAFPAFAPVPEGVVGDVEGYVGRMSYRAFAEAPVGSGPFAIDHWRRNEEVAVSRFDDYHGAGPDLDGVRWRIVTDSTAAYNYGQNRNADLLTVPDDEYDPRSVRVARTDDRGRRFGEYGPMENGETVSYLAAPLARTYYIAFNTDNVPKAARRAVAYTLNQQSMVDEVLNGRAEPAAHLTPPPIYPNGDYASHADGEYPYSYDATEYSEATQTMEDAGYTASGKFQFTLTMYSSPTLRQVAQRLQDKLGSAHIDLQIEVEPFSTLLNRAMKGTVDAYLLGWAPNYPRPDDFLQNMNPPATRTDGSTDGFYLDWGGTDASAAAERAWRRVEAHRGPTDRARRARERAYVAMEEANWEDVALLPLYHPVDERFAYDDVDIAPFGGLGSTYQEYDGVVKGN